MEPQKKNNLLPQEQPFHFTFDLTYALELRNQGDAAIVSPPKGTHGGSTPNQETINFAPPTTEELEKVRESESGQQFLMILSRDVHVSRSDFSRTVGAQVTFRLHQ